MAINTNRFLSVFPLFFHFLFMSFLLILKMLYSDRSHQSLYDGLCMIDRGPRDSHFQSARHPFQPGF